ncbi:hypothetical protein CHUAL_010406 [Chamberlinius hualienensis]
MLIIGWLNGAGEDDVLTAATCLFSVVRVVPAPHSVYPALLFVHHELALVELFIWLMVSAILAEARVNVGLMPKVSFGCCEWSSFSFLP